MDWLSKIPMPESDTEKLHGEGELSDDSGNDGNDEESVENGLISDAKARRRSFASFASKTLSLCSNRKGSIDVSAPKRRISTQIEKGPFLKPLSLCYIIHIYYVQVLCESKTSLGAQQVWKCVLLVKILKCSYGSDSARQEKGLFYVLFS